MSPSRKSLGSAVAMPLIIGMIGLTTVLQRPRLASVATVDIVQLLGSGLCFGVALVALFALLRASRNS
jgi:hypothetical protein